VIQGQETSLTTPFQRTDLHPNAMTRSTMSWKHSQSTQNCHNTHRHTHTLL